MHLVLLEENISMSIVPDMSQWFHDNVRNEWIIINGNHGSTLNFDVFNDGQSDQTTKNKICVAIFGFKNIDEALLFKLRWSGNTEEAN